MTTEPSARVTVNEKPVPGVNTDELTSEANTKKPPPSATAKLTVPVPALSSAPSRLAAAPRAQCAVARPTESWGDETTVVEVTVTPAPSEALAPAWKFVPVTLTVRLAPGAPEPGDTLAIVGTVKVTVATAEEPSAKVAVRVKLAPLLNCVGLKSDRKSTRLNSSHTTKPNAA